ncbi:MAG: poly(R)-hydroxyalkanoic acid synthase subunit PhaE [Pseudomonadota bacterium]
MAENDFEKMMKLWASGSEAFMKAQADMVEKFGESIAPKPKDPFEESMEAWQNFIKSWAPGWDPSLFTKPGFGGSRDAYFAMFDTSTWATHAPDQLRSIFQSMTNIPKLADFYNPSPQLGAQWQEVLDFQQATQKFGTVMQSAWQRAYGRFSQKYSLDDLKSGDVKGALDAWLKAANEELLDIQSTQAFMDAQRAMIVATTQLTKRQAEWAESWAEKLQLPTRTEIDDLTKTVYELKKEIRNLKKELKGT